MSRYALAPGMPAAECALSQLARWADAACPGEHIEADIAVTDDGAGDLRVVARYGRHAGALGEQVTRMLPERRA